MTKYLLKLQDYWLLRLPYIGWIQDGLHEVEFNHQWTCEQKPELSQTRTYHSRMVASAQGDDLKCSSISSFAFQTDHWATKEIKQSQQKST